MQDLGFRSFVVRYGVLGLGIPIGAIVDFVYLTLGDNWPMFFSELHLAQFVCVVLVSASTVGAAGGYVLWRLGQRRAREADLERAFRV